MPLSVDFAWARSSKLARTSLTLGGLAGEWAVEATSGVVSITDIGTKSSGVSGKSAGRTASTGSPARQRTDKPVPAVAKSLPGERGGKVAYALTTDKVRFCRR